MPMRPCFAARRRRFLPAARPALILALLLNLVLAGTPPAAAAQAPATGDPAAERATVEDLAWLAGHWRGEEAGSLSEEIWMEPAGGSMLGMWRLVTDGEARVFELLALVERESGPVLLIRHFGPALVAREAVASPVTLPLLGAAAGEAIFEGDENGKTVRLTYRREGEDGLVAVLEKPDAPAAEIRFRRVPPAP